MKPLRFFALAICWGAAVSAALSQSIQDLMNASPTNPVDATWLIVNPSFETGDETGWTLTGKDPQGNDEFRTRDYGMTGKDGRFLMNAYQWWASSLSVSQTVDNMPAGIYEISAVVATWEGRHVWFTANSSTVSVAGINDATGIPVTMPLTIGAGQPLSISAGSTAAWWEEGREGETQTFFKLDNVRLACKGVFLDAVATPLPNDNATTLQAGQWYYFDAPYHTQYLLRGQVADLVYATDGLVPVGEVTTQAADHVLTLNKGRVYFKTSRSDATLSIDTERTIGETTFNAVALNVDGLPQKIAFFNLNEDGPGSEGTKLISQYLARKGYDLIGVSEDFNYHGSLMSALTNDYSSGTVRATLSIGDLGFPFDTDGLNLLWRHSTIGASNESWTQWQETTPTDGNQYVKKGFRHYDMTIGDNMLMDVYVLHMDAGDATPTREAQWRQLAQAINQGSADRPVLIIGDTNSRWTREDIATNFKNIIANHSVGDTWVELCRGNVYPDTSMDDLTDQSDPANYANYEVVDKIIYLNPRNANTLQLAPLSFRIEQDYTYGNVEGNNNTKALGDHRPLVVEFRCTQAGDMKSIVGDVNRDGMVNIADVTALVEIILGHDDNEPYRYDHLAADVNMDGAISVVDVTELVNIILE